MKVIMHKEPFKSTGCPYCDVGLQANHAGEHWGTWSHGFRYAKACTRDDDPTYTDERGYRRARGEC